MNDEELQAHKDKGEGYRLGDVIGKMGVEAAFEQTLRGEWGGRQVEVDGAGQIVRILGKKPARAGSDVHLTLDLELQKAAEAALGNHNGALVAMDGYSLGSTCGLSATFFKSVTNIAPV